MMEQTLPLLRVADDRRHLVTENGEPFFWMGDTAWELFHRLSREEAEQYLDCRAEQGFTVLQAVALAELSGITVPNAHGRLPLRQNAQGQWDPTLPDLNVEPGGASYWDHVDRIVDMAAERGIYIGMLPTWGDKYNRMWGEGPEIFTAENAEIYGNWIGRRYRGRANIIWILGGDRPLLTRRHFDIIQAMACGIRNGDEGRHLITFHPSGGRSSSGPLHEEIWLDFNMIQSGHGRDQFCNWTFIDKDRALSPIKPTLDGEPRYEDHPIDFNPKNGYFDATDARTGLWWATLAGGLGVTYGHHAIWSMRTEPEPYWPLTWRQALRRPCAQQVRHLRNLMLSRPLVGLEPDETLLAGQYEGANHIAASRGEKHAFLYTPNGLEVKARLGVLAGTQVKVSWYNPRTGETTEVGVIANEGEKGFRPETSGRGEDWVLVMDVMD